MERQVFVLSHPLARRNAALACNQAPDGFRVEIKPPAKSRDQEALYHAVFAEAARSKEFMGRKHDAETWKRLLVDAFAKLKQDEGNPLNGAGFVVPSLDGQRVVQLGVQTRRFTKGEASEFIEFLNAWMAHEEVAA